MTVSAEISEADIEKVDAGQSRLFHHAGRPQTSATTPSCAPSRRRRDSIEIGSRLRRPRPPRAVYYNGLFDVDNKDGKLTHRHDRAGLHRARLGEGRPPPFPPPRSKAAAAAATTRASRGQGRQDRERPVKIGINTTSPRRCSKASGKATRSSSPKPPRSSRLPAQPAAQPARSAQAAAAAALAAVVAAADIGREPSRQSTCDRPRPRPLRASAADPARARLPRISPPAMKSSSCSRTSTSTIECRRDGRHHRRSRARASRR